MGYQTGDGSWPGETPGQDAGLPRPPGQPAGSGPERFDHGGFDHGGPWAGAAPSAALATALERAAGPQDRYAGAGTDALVGIARQWAAVESWAAAGKLAALRAMTREDADGTPRLRRRPDLPEGWDDSLTYEISGALAMGPVSAGNLAHLAWTLGTRLAGIGRLLADGTLTLPKARLIAQLLAPARRRRGGPRRGTDPRRAGRQDLPPGRAAGLAGRPGGRPGCRGAPPDGGRGARAGHGVP